LPAIKALCSGAHVVFVISGLGGATGTRLGPIIAQAAHETGALVLAFVTTPFDCEGSHRQRLALEGLDQIKAAADGVIALANQRAAKLIDENTSVIETFKLANELLADGVRGVWRLLMHPGLIEIHFADLCALVRDRHTESCFAVAEGLGATRSRDVTEKLFAHPMLDGGQVLGQSEAVLVSLMGGPDLTMAEVNRVMEQISRKCERAQVIMGAAIDESFRERLAVTLVAARRNPDRPEESPRPALKAQELDTHLLDREESPRPGSRFVPPPPTLQPEQMEQLLARQSGSTARPRKKPAKLKQTQLPLDIISKGRFDKSEPTIHKGEVLDVPTYIRRGVSLN
jgi:cell division protein FtsZ